MTNDPHKNAVEDVATTTREMNSTGRPAQAAGFERRASPRHTVNATAEAIEQKSRTRVTGRCADLSYGGCYVDTISPFPLGAEIIVRLKHERGSFESTAKVIYSKVGMGMGVSFLNTAPKERAKLEGWFAHLSEDLSLSEEPKEEGSETAKALLNERHVLNQLIVTLVRKRMLTESEGAALLRELFR